MSEPETTPRMNAATLAKYQHEERMAQATKARGDLPSFALKRSTASGSLGVIGIDVNVPVCEEYPTADAALAAARKFMDDLCEAYPMPEPVIKTDAEKLAGATRRGAIAARAKS